RYLDPIYRYVHYRLPNVEEAEDLTERVFLKIWELICDQKITKINNFQAWLYRVAHNQVIDYHRKKKPITIDTQEETGLFGKSDLNTESDVQKKLDQQALLAAVEKLDDQSQEVIVLRFMNDLSHAEVAKILDLEPGHVRVLQHRAINQLRKIMKDFDHE
ncbi:MAG: RNA polymerase sigma factor, partial [Anaerolineales bacterium]